MLDAVQKPKPKKGRFLRLWLALVMLVLLASGIFAGSKLVILAQKILETGDGKISFAQLFLAKNKSLTGEETGEIRILLLGIGGGTHEGPTLTDTIILATLKLPQEEQSGQEPPRLSLVSIPRDLVVNVPGSSDYRKINSAYAFGEIGGEGGGPRLALQSLEQLVGEQIPYYAVVDFQGFKTIVDDLGGIIINVEREFTDSRYPDEQLGYLAPLKFEAGLQKMDGERALQFVRSRHGNNNEGTDFARSRRQQKVLEAIRDKILGLNVLTNLGLLNRLMDDFADHLRTNLEPYELKALYDLTRELKKENIISSGIDPESGLVCDQIEEETGAYILVPCAGLLDLSGIRNFFHDQFIVGGLRKENSIVEIQNASGIEFLGGRAKSYLAAPFLQISSANFQGQARYQESILYDNTKGQKPETRKYLQNKLGLPAASSPFPFSMANPNADFVIILTADLEQKLP